MPWLTLDMPEQKWKSLRLAMVSTVTSQRESGSCTRYYAHHPADPLGALDPGLKARSRQGTGSFDQLFSRSAVFMKSCCFGRPSISLLKPWPISEAAIMHDDGRRIGKYWLDVSSPVSFRKRCLLLSSSYATVPTSHACRASVLAGARRPACRVETAGSPVGIKCICNRSVLLMSDCNIAWLRPSSARFRQKRPDCKLCGLRSPVAGLAARALTLTFSNCIP